MLRLWQEHLSTRYARVGLALLGTGSGFALLAWGLIGYPPLVALGMGLAMVGGVALALGVFSPRLSPEAGQVFLEAGYTNLASLLEEVGAFAPALYLPGSWTGQGPRALVPLRRNPPPLRLRPPLRPRFVVAFGEAPEDLGLLVDTPGSALLRAYPLTEGEGLEEACRRYLVGVLDLAGGVALRREGRDLTVEVDQPALLPQPHPAERVLGSPIASIVATLSAEVLGQPVQVVGEEGEQRRRIHLRLWGGGNGEA